MTSTSYIVSTSSHLAINGISALFQICLTSLHVLCLVTFYKLFLVTKSQNFTLFMIFINYSLDNNLPYVKIVSQIMNYQSAILINQRIKTAMLLSVTENHAPWAGSSSKFECPASNLLIHLVFLCSSHLYHIQKQAPDKFQMDCPFACKNLLTPVTTNIDHFSSFFYFFHYSSVCS